jgi:hypothetical protein
MEIVQSGHIESGDFVDSEPLKAPVDISLTNVKFMSDKSLDRISFVRLKHRALDTASELRFNGQIASPRVFFGPLNRFGVHHDRRSGYPVRLFRRCSPPLGG